MAPLTNPRSRENGVDQQMADVDISNKGYCPSSIVGYLERMTTVPEPKLQEPPSKRQRLDSDSNLDYMVVKRSSLTLKFRQSPRKNSRLPLTYQSETVGTQVEESGSQVLLRISDNGGRDWNVLDETFDADNVPIRDINIAGVIPFRAHYKHNPTAHGRLWAETTFSLSVEKGFEVLLLTWTVKWNLCPSLAYISATLPKRHHLESVIEAYFSDPAQSDNKGARILPQDFYNSVHVPEKKDAEATLIEIPELKTPLYPFQKRSVRWLLEREGVQWSAGENCMKDATVKPEETPCSFYEVVDGDGRTCWVSSLLQAATRDLSAYKAAEDELIGGLLVEEMGLGKTLEITALITLHRSRPDSLKPIVDPYTRHEAVPTKATLIITPPSILQQWQSELARHAPSLKVMHYQGKSKHKRLSHEQLLDMIAEHDVVLTTYRVLAGEIYHAAPGPGRVSRHLDGSQQNMSVFTHFLWWRCVLDEAQMIEGSVTNAATMAQMVPRVNSWGVTGTPVKKDVEDLFGLLKFIRYEPFGILPWTWAALLRNPPAFQSVFQRIALRHTKSIVRDELQLPPQKRYVITMPFTPVEEQHYQSLFQKMCDECGVDLQGGSLADDWDPTRIRTMERMRAWLSRLRQSALHPEIGVKNRRVLGRKDGPLRTVGEVLETMLEQTELSIRGDQRTLHLTRLKRGQTLENSPRVKEALKIWKRVLADTNAAVSVCREQLQSEIDSPKGNMALGGGPLLNDDEISSGDNSDIDDREPGAESTLRVGALRNRLNAALEIQHIAVFFCANAYFQIKSNEEMTKPDSEEFMEFEKLEAEGYQQAKMIRQEILKEIFRKNTKPMERLAEKASSEDFLSIPEFHINTQKGGIESTILLEQLDGLAAALDAQANQLDEWRETTIQNLLRPLVDEEGVIEMTGEEYLQSTELQQEIVIYVLALRAVIEDRHDALTGQENQLVKHEVQVAIKQAKDNIEQAEAEQAEAIVDQAEAEQAEAVVEQAETDVEADIELAKAGKWSLPQRTLDLLQARAELKPPKAMGSVKGILSELRTLSSQLRMDATKGSSRAANELVIIERNMAIVRPHLEKQLKAVTALRQEIDEFTSLMNLRVEYYRQLQQISDMVLPLGEDSPPDLPISLLETEQKLAAKIATTSSKLRYLVHLKEESKEDAEGKDCLICTAPFENGSLTVCGHIFCKECMGLWFRGHKNCPACKRELTINDLHDITYKPRELKMAEEAPITPHNQDRALVSPSKKSGIYSQISNDTLAQIKNIDLVGPSFTTKVDTLCRHLLWLREADPFAKSIIFSQFSDFLVILGHAFTHHRIGYSAIDKPGGIEKFKNDPATECFLLHAKSQSSGLNLVNASHVFLCEPLINTALELQAIARVDRIGQQQATTVWLYLIDGTVEEAIYDISVRRRMEHMGGASTAPSKESTPELADRKIQVANSLELQQAPLANLLAKGKESGEFVGNDDLWECLFGNRKRAVEGAAAAEERLDREVARHFGAEAAEARIANGE
ncbi:hypothetical protein VC83_02938 [Pseudogymnoascus destructans]|uniref:RING-type domain-containing protein n=2 Tax=Pseudogymnoascus destructans TaxID=655981 RepID=L8FM18_PSED2|nr:uncharacterized protein VC83_02938 [Pseudogymnoascus destructans]ELR01965.1 hypothetical protein GMDG_05137 [Pseudogymnoascus destructans 20631-21]OAF59979.1 hypothetical protein VC83_02938 [Pseudogymnoascus destructans]